MLEQAERLMAEYDMLPPGATVLCAVSGGADSMCLLHYLSRRGDLTLHAGHFDHQLRGEASARDAAFVRDWCRDHSIPFHLGTADVAGEARRLKTGIEETARALRYGFLSRLAGELGAERIATAHNADDNAETVLMHLLRGSGLQGLTGIDPIRGSYIRPLLTTPRAQIEAYLEAHGVPHVEDATNADDACARNRVRHRLMPLMEELGPGFVERMTAAIPRLRGDNDCLNASAWQALRGVERRGDDLVLSARVLSGTPRPIAVRAARLLLQAANGGDADCTAAHLEAVLDLARSTRPSAQLHLPRGLTVRREYDKLIFTHRPPPGPLSPLSPREGDNPIPGTGWRLLLDCPPWPGLVVRPRQAGDALTLPGRPRKTVKKLLIDAKLPRQDREQLPLCADDQGVLALAGFGPNLDHPKSGTVKFYQ